MANINWHTKYFSLPLKIFVFLLMSYSQHPMISVGVQADHVLNYLVLSEKSA